MSEQIYTEAHSGIRITVEDDGSPYLTVSWIEVDGPDAMGGIAHMDRADVAEFVEGGEWLPREEG